MMGFFHRTIDRVTERVVGMTKKYLPDLRQYNAIRWTPPEDLTVFFHIPRTAGDSMRTHLFNAAEWDFTPWGHVPEPLTVEEIATLSRHRFIKGFLSRNDLVRLPCPRVFTFLRDPIERSLSLFYFLRRGRSPLKRTLGVEEFFTSDHPLLASYSRNGMTWQLGDSLNIERRTVSGSEALERACQTLDSMEFVGFYEDLSRDFVSVRKKMFPGLRISPVFPMIFQLGAFFALHRRRVRKYAASITDSERALVRQVNVLDHQLYAYARKRAGRSAGLHDSYEAWMRSLLPRREAPPASTR